MIRLLPAILLVLFLFLLFTCTGCTRNAKNLDQIRGATAERARESVAVAAAAIRRQPVEHVTKETKLTAKAIDRTQTLIGLPIMEQESTVDALLSSNATLRAEAEAAWIDAVAQEQEWKAKEAALSSKLEDMGRELEKERNKSIVKRTWFWLTSTLGIGGIIALCVFFPFLIPIFGRLLAWVVGKIPALAGAVGVVSTKAYDAVVKGIDGAKDEFKKHGDGDDDAAVLDNNLGRSMDESHKKLVRQRKVAVAK